MFSQIGLVTLIGLITKHGVLIVQFANQLCQTNLNALEAVKQAALVRLRPILMTTGESVHVPAASTPVDVFDSLLAALLWFRQD